MFILGSGGFGAIMATAKLCRIVSFEEKKWGDNLCNLAVALQHEPWQHERVLIWNVTESTKEEFLSVSNGCDAIYS